MAEWIRFYITAALILTGLIAYAAAVVGAWRFGFVMNRMHAAGIGDTLALFAIVLGLIITSGHILDMLKLVLLVVFMWFTSPVSTHFLGQVEYYTNKALGNYVKTDKEEDTHAAD